MERAFTPRLFTVDEFYKMAEAGILSEDDRVELLDGRIVEMSPINHPHASCVRRLDRRLQANAGRYLVSVQNPVRLEAHSEPVSDIALLRPEFPDNRHPEPHDVLVVIEVGDSSVVYDRKVKAPLYARSGIPEYWVVDLRGQRVFLYHDPVDGSYRRVRRLGSGGKVRSETVSGLVIPVDDILGL